MSTYFQVRLTMAKETAVPFQVRFPSAMLGRLRDSASKRGVSAHTEIIERLEASLVAEEDPRTEAIKTATLAMLPASHLGLGDALSSDYVLSQFKLAMTTLFDALKVEDSSSEVTQAAAKKVIDEL